MKRKLENPGPWSFAVFGAACGITLAAFAFKVPDAGKIALALVGLAAAWLSKSAIGSEGGAS